MVSSLGFCIVLCSIFQSYSNVQQLALETSNKVFRNLVSEKVQSITNGTLYTYNLTYVNTFDAKTAWQHMHLVSAFSGLVNREFAQFYYFLTPSDVLWLDYLKKKHSFKDIHAIPPTDLAALLSAITPKNTPTWKVVLYDPNVAATSNVASTIAGIEGLLPVVYLPEESHSLYTQLVKSGPKLEVGMSLVDKFNGTVTSSKKCDAYVWALDKYVKTGLTTGAILAYYIDYFWTTNTQNLPYAQSTLTNHDFFISNKAFFFDLDPWSDEAPNDDPTQKVGTDSHTLLKILQAAYTQTKGEEMIHLGGFIPWAWKYVGKFSKHNHQGVATEWYTIKITSSYNVLADADACCFAYMANAAFYQHYALPERYIQNRPPTKEECIAAGYLDTTGTKVVPALYYMFYAGDYDAAAWLTNRFPYLYNDPNRGKVPIGWAVDGELALRNPLAFEYMQSMRTSNDFFISGDSGSGYLNPTQLIPPRAPSNESKSGVAAWKAWNTYFYQKFNYKFTGFIIQGDSGQITKQAEQEYLPYSHQGLVIQGGFDTKSPRYYLLGQTPVFHQASDLPTCDDHACITQAAQRILSKCPKPHHHNHTTQNDPQDSSATQFWMFRSILRSASWHYYVAGNTSAMAPSGCSVKVVSPLTLTYLARVALGTQNIGDYASYINDTIPRALRQSTDYPKPLFCVRNEDWTTWTVPKIQLVWQIVHANNAAGSHSGKAKLMGDVGSGGVGCFVGSSYSVGALPVGGAVLSYGVAGLDSKWGSDVYSVPISISKKE